MRSKKPTLKDMAQEAGVGRATLARYLKDADSVKLKTRQKITKILLKYNELPHFSPSLGKKQKVVYFRVLSENSFLLSLEQTLLSHLSLAGIEGRSICLSNREDMMISQIKKASEDSDILIFTIPHSPKVRYYLELLAQQGKKIITLISDIPSLSRAAFVGIDNMAAGRCAAHMALKFCKKQNPNILILAGDILLDDHKFRQLGFMQYLEQNQVSEFPKIIDCKETRHNLEAYVMENIQNIKDLDIIYSTPMRNQILYKILKKLNLNPKPVVITHELSFWAKEGLMNGFFDLVIMQDVEEIAYQSLQIIQSLIAGFPLEKNIVVWNKIHLITMENMSFNHFHHIRDYFTKNQNPLLYPS